MGWFHDFVAKRKINRLNNLARRLAGEKRFAEAANAYAKAADLYLPERDLLFAMECQWSFDVWMQAGDAKSALVQGLRALNGYKMGGWLKDNSYVKEISDRVGDLRKADHFEEADVLLTEINKCLIAIGEGPVEVVAVGTDHRFPETCPHCGGFITYHGNLEETLCPFCSGVVHAL